MPKVIALGTSDWHIHKFRNFNENNQRLTVCLKAMQLLADRAHKLKVPVLFAGDLFHNPKEVENETMAKTLSTFNMWYERRGVPLVGISGNHDFAEKNGIEQKSPSHLDSFEHFKHFLKLDYTQFTFPNFVVHGLPYMNSDKELSKAIKELKPTSKATNILMLHTDFPGAKTPEGIEVKETEHLNARMLKDWDIVLFGHIHMPQKLAKNCWMMGPPCHQNVGDEGQDMGYWEIYNDGSLKFKALDLPRFIRLKAGETPKDDGNYYVNPEVVLVDEEVVTGEFAISNSRKKLASLYLKKKGIKLKSRKRALIQILNEVE